MEVGERFKSSLTFLYQVLTKNYDSLINKVQEQKVSSAVVCFHVKHTWCQNIQVKNICWVYVNVPESWLVQTYTTSCCVQTGFNAVIKTSLQTDSLMYSCVFNWFIVLDS